MFSDAVVAGSGAEGYTAAQRTILAPDTTFPLVDAFSPVSRARVPVPGYTAWPGAANNLGKRYYGLNGGASVGKDAAGVAKVQRGMGGIFDSFFPPPSDTGPTITIGGEGGSGGGTSIWDRIFGTIQTTLPATISAITGRGDPGYYARNQQGQVAPSGYVYNQQGQLISLASAQAALGGVGVAGATLTNSISNFVQQNPMIVLGLGVGLVLLFTRPPSRR